MKTSSTESDLRNVFGKESVTMFLRGVRLFNDGKHWEAHEVFEDLWREHDGEVKILAQGFVQLAAAFSYIRVGRYESILYLFDKSTEKLAATAHLLPRANLSQLIEAMKIAGDEVKRLGEKGLVRFPLFLYPKIILGRQSHRTRRGKSRRR